MKFKFLISFVLIGASLIQVTSAQLSINTGIQIGIVGEVMENAKKIIESIQITIQSKINEALGTLNNLKLKITQQGNESIAIMRKDLENIIAKAKIAIEEIKDKAGQLGIDIFDCIKDNTKNFEDLFVKFLDNEVHCVTGEVETVIDIITGTMQILLTLADEIKNLPHELINCATNNNKILCVFELIAKGVKLQLKLSTEVADKIREVIVFAAGLQLRLQTCPVIQLATAGVGATKIVSGVALCAFDKGVK